MENYIIHINQKEKTETIKHIEDAIHELSNFDDDVPHEKLVDVFEAIRFAICRHDKVMIPVEITEEKLNDLQQSAQPTNTFFPEGVPLKLRVMELSNGKHSFAAFTDVKKANAGDASSTLTEDLESLLERALMNQNIGGVVFNPWNESFFLSNEHIRSIFNANVPRRAENIISIQTLDITEADTSCIVNAANESLLGGGGVDGAIHRAAGKELIEECRTLNGCKTGEAKITKGYNLKADYVIHTVGPIYSGSPKDAKFLRNCYWNSLELAKMNDIHSITFPAISTGVYGYPLNEATEIAIKTVSDWLKVNPHHGMAILFACYDMKTKDIYDAIWDKYENSWNERPILKENDGKLEEAIQMAMDAHKGSVRKGTTKPYILHPIETVQILSSMDADTNLLIAGILHDTLEDTDMTCLDIYDKFGVDVAALVNEHTEDKRKIWYMRKLIKTTYLPNDNVRSKMLTIADKVANMRNMLSDYNAIGEEFWNRFNAPKHLQAWYYSNLCDGLEELQDYENTKAVYWEMMQLYKDLFVQFFVDDSKGLLYQISDSGEGYVLKKGNPQWNELSGSPSKKARLISRKEAERIEDNWAEPFWDVHALDLSDASYKLYNESDGYIFIEIKDGVLSFNDEFLNPPDPSTGFHSDIYYTLNTDDTHRFLMQLRLKHGIRNKLSTILKKEFGYSDGPQKFNAFCNEIGVQVQVIRF